jgi:hypothetical protein
MNRLRSHGYAYDLYVRMLQHTLHGYGLSKLVHSSGRLKRHTCAALKRECFAWEALACWELAAPSGGDEGREAPLLSEVGLTALPSGAGPACLPRSCRDRASSAASSSTSCALAAAMAAANAPPRLFQVPGIIMQSFNADSTCPSPIHVIKA